MGRSVSYASHSEIIVYKDCSSFGYSDTSFCNDCYEYFDFVDGKHLCTCPECGSTDMKDKSSEYDDGQGEADWDCFTDMLIEDLKEMYPSLTYVDNKWLGSEDMVLMENNLVYVGLSQYCGLVSLWVTPRGMHDENYYDKDSTPLAVRWCNQIRSKFWDKFSDLKKIGTFSNGESVFERVA